MSFLAKLLSGSHRGCPSEGFIPAVSVSSATTDKLFIRARHTRIVPQFFLGVIANEKDVHLSLNTVPRKRWRCVLNKRGERKKKHNRVRVARLDEAVFFQIPHGRPVVIPSRCGGFTLRTADIPRISEPLESLLHCGEIIKDRYRGPPRVFSIPLFAPSGSTRRAA